MEYVVGTVLALGVVVFARVFGFDRDRVFYPVLLIVTASYYDLFAVLGGSGETLVAETVILSLFVVVAVIGFKTNLWVVVGALVGHGTMDFFSWRHDRQSRPPGLVADVLPELRSGSRRLPCIPAASPGVFRNSRARQATGWRRQDHVGWRNRELLTIDGNSSAAFLLHQRLMAEDLLIHALGPKGDGVHRSERGPVYIDRALPGDTVQAKIQSGAGDVLRGDLLRLITASEHRLPAPCRHYDFCGGCTLQHATNQFYRDWKLDIVRSALYKKSLEPALWREPIFLPAGHRRRVTFAAAKKNNVVTLGYFRRRSHQVTDITACLVADPAIMNLRTGLVTALVPILQDGKTADIFIQLVNGQCEVVITGPVGKKGVPDFQVHEGIAQFAHALKINRLSWRTRDRDNPEVMLEISPLRAQFGPLDVTLPPLAFLQPTKIGEDALVGAVLDLLPKAGKCADLFSGCGTFSGAMLARGPVDAYEGVESYVRALDSSKGARPLKAIQRDLFRSPLRSDEASRYDAIVFDPPRAGAQEQARMLSASQAPLLIGVSCDPATFARDARILVDGGYSFDTIKVIDQFTWTHHVELVASFSKHA